MPNIVLPFFSDFSSSSKWMYGIGLCDCVSRVSQQVIYIYKHTYTYIPVLLMAHYIIITPLCILFVNHISLLCLLFDPENIDYLVPLPPYTIYLYNFCGDISFWWTRCIWIFHSSLWVISQFFFPKRTSALEAEFSYSFFLVRASREYNDDNKYKKKGKKRKYTSRLKRILCTYFLINYSSFFLIFTTHLIWRAVLLRDQPSNLKRGDVRLLARQLVTTTLESVT